MILIALILWVAAVAAGVFYELLDVRWAAILFLLGVLVALRLVRLAASGTGDGESRREFPLELFGFLLVSGSAAATTEMISAPAAAAFVVLGFLSIQFAQRLVDSLDGGDRVGVASRFGGLAGGQGGWKASPALIYMILTLVFALLLVAAIGSEVSWQRAKAGLCEEEKDTTSPNEESSGTSGSASDATETAADPPGSPPQAEEGELDTPAGETGG